MFLESSCDPPLLLTMAMPSFGLDKHLLAQVINEMICIATSVFNLAAGAGFPSLVPPMWYIMPQICWRVCLKLRGSPLRVWTFSMNSHGAWSGICATLTMFNVSLRCYVHAIPLAKSGSNFLLSPKTMIYCRQSLFLLCRLPPLLWLRSLLWVLREESQDTAANRLQIRFTTSSVIMASDICFFIKEEPLFLLALIFSGCGHYDFNCNHDLTPRSSRRRTIISLSQHV